MKSIFRAIADAVGAAADAVGRSASFLRNLLSELFGPAVDNPPQGLVFIFYYVWYGTPTLNGSWRHWDGGNPNRPGLPDNILSNFYPALNPYSSSDSTVIAQHMQWLQSTGVDVLAISWWGQGSYEDSRVAAVLAAAALQGLKCAIVIEPYSGQTASSVQSDIAYIISTYGSSPAFLYASRPTQYGPSTGARPVIFLYRPNGTTLGGLKNVLDGTRGTSSDAIFLLDDLESDMNSQSAATAKVNQYHPDGLFNYGWATYGYPASPPFPLPTSNANYLLVYTAAPGHYDTRQGLTHTIDHSAYNYESGFNSIYNQHPEWMSITSFNEWHDGSQIEPAQPKTYVNAPDFVYLNYTGEYGNPDPQARTDYLTATANYVALYHRSGPQRVLSSNPSASESVGPASDFLSFIKAHPIIDGIIMAFARSGRLIGRARDGNLATKD